MNVVTGAFGYIGRYITAHLLESGEAVKTITTHPHKPNPFGAAVEALGHGTVVVFPGPLSPGFAPWPKGKSPFALKKRAPGWRSV